jgi:hypothetical protein
LHWRAVIDREGGEGVRKGDRGGGVRRVIGGVGVDRRERIWAGLWRKLRWRLYWLR